MNCAPRNSCNFNVAKLVQEYVVKNQATFNKTGMWPSPE
jgi:hypothetical protein